MQNTKRERWYENYIGYSSSWENSKSLIRDESGGSYGEEKKADIRHCFRHNPFKTC